MGQGEPPPSVAENLSDFWKQQIRLHGSPSFF